MNKDKYKNLIFTIAIVLSVSASFVFGVYASETKVVQIPFPKLNIAVASTPSTKENTDMDLFFTVWNTLKAKSIHTGEKTDQEMIYGAIQGLASSLGDPYTVFMPPTETKQFNESITGSFGGIGAEIGQKDNLITIIAPLKDSPAERSGIKSGDKIIKIDGTLVGDSSIDQAISKIRGKKGTTVKLEIYRDSDKSTKIIDIMRDTILIPTTKTEIIDGVFVVHIYNFGEHATKEFKDAINKFKNSGSNYLIIDLRGNPGGYLEAAVDIGSYFIPKGKTIVSEDYVISGKKEIHTSYGYTDLKKTPKIVVLVDGGSASASEILAGALHDHKIAKLVGVKTFGKGSVQEVVDMKNNTSLKVTIARWLIPSGITIDKNGIAPDIEVKYVADPKNTKADNQLKKALEVVKQ